MHHHQSITPHIAGGTAGAGVPAAATCLATLAPSSCTTVAIPACASPSKCQYHGHCGLADLEQAHAPTPPWPSNASPMVLLMVKYPPSLLYILGEAGAWGGGQAGQE